MSSLTLSVILAMVLGTHPPSEPVPAYTVDASQGFGILLLLDLANGTEFPATVIGDFALDLRLRALALDPWGSLYGIDAFKQQLLLIDRDTAETTVVGDLGQEVHTYLSMTFDGCGRLWWLDQQPFIAGQERMAHLYKVDPLNGQAELHTVLTGFWHGLASFSEGLMTGHFVNGEGFFLHRLVTATGETTQLFAIDTFVVPYLGFELDGSLWGLSPGPIIAPPPPAVSLAIDFEQGVANEVSDFGIHHRYVGLAVAPPGGPCASACSLAGDVLCLNDNRFRVEINWRDFGDRRGRGQVAPARSDDSGLSWFFESKNWEMLVKVVDGCVKNDHFWVFATASGSVEFELLITDTFTGETFRHFNPLGQPAEFISDTRAFATCP